MKMLLIAFFTNNGTPQTGLSPTMDVWLPDGSKVVNSETMTEIAGGFYKHEFVAYDGNKDYSIRADGGATLNAADRFVYATNELDVNVGGGLGITGDMIFDLKKLADNIITKKDLEKFLKELSTQIDSIKKKSASLETIDGIINTISKVSNKIDSLVKNKETSQQTAIELKEELKKLSEKISNQKTDLINSTSAIAKSLDEFRKESKLSIETKVGEIINSLSNVKQKIAALDKTTMSKLQEESERIINNFSSKAETNSQTISKMESERQKSLSELYSKFQEVAKITELSNNILGRFDASNVKLESIENSTNQLKSFSEKYSEFFKQIDSKYRSLRETLNLLLENTKEDKTKELLSVFKDENSNLLNNLNQLFKELKSSNNQQESLLQNNNSENIELLNSLNTLVGEIKQELGTIDLSKSFAEIKSDLSNIRIRLEKFEQINKLIKRQNSVDDLSDVESQINSIKNDY